MVTVGVCFFTVFRRIFTGVLLVSLHYILFLIVSKNAEKNDKHRRRGSRPKRICFVRFSCINKKVQSEKET